MLWWIQVIWKYFLSVNSSSEHGSLFQLRNIISYKNVKTDPTANFNACDDFYQTVIHAHIIAAFEEMSHGNFDPAMDWMKSDQQRRDMVLSFSTRIVDSYIDFS